MKTEQIQADIKACTEKIKKAIDNDCLSIIPIYLELIEELTKQLTTVEKNVQQNTIDYSQSYNITTIEEIINKPLKEGIYYIEKDFDNFVKTAFYEFVLIKFPKSNAVAVYNQTLLTILK